MNYLIDTHALIWYAEGDQRLPNSVKDLIIDRNNAVFYSHASIWEMAIKISLDKLALTITLPAWEGIINGKWLFPAALQLTTYNLEPTTYNLQPTTHNRELSTPQRRLSLKKQQQHGFYPASLVARRP